MHSHTIRAAFLLSFASAVAHAQSGSSQVAARRYSIFSPVPADKLREMTTDRPDKTESPFTVDAGHFQIELDGMTWTRDRSASTTTESWSVVPVNFKAGLLPNLDLQVIVEPQTGSRTMGSVVTPTTREFGAVTARLKYNFWGNDGDGQTAFSVMPFVSRSPVDGARVTEGGVIFPLAVSLAKGWDLGTMVEGDLVADDATSIRRRVLVTSATIGHELSERVGVYSEFHSEMSRLPWIATADAGLTFAVTPKTQLDFGANLGLTRAADDLNLFFGLSVRF